ncbi:MAG: thiol-disulfide oxidoreductase ResA [Bacillaceae bacterium]|nr:thiol-disulfide oxidoreductase ResA [Bacillaceae bacterium]
MNADRKKKRFVFRAIVLFVLIAAVIVTLVSSFMEDNPVVKAGDMAPNFVLKQVNGDQTFELHKLRGKGVMLNFWATYCDPCKEEMPYMEQLYPEYKEKGIEILAVSLDTTELVVKNFIDDYDLTFPVVHDKRGDVMDLYKIGPIPTTYFINPEGEVVRVVKGPLTLNRLEAYFQEILPGQN